jgi:membrane protease subunit (stomatin/prohibitin family)
MLDSKPGEKVNPLHLLNQKNYGELEEANRRLSVCYKCPSFTKVKTCKECGCFMVAKTRLKDATCPLDKW